jgi:hypothetical protein
MWLGVVLPFSSATKTQPGNFSLLDSDSVLAGRKEMTSSKGLTKEI